MGAQQNLITQQQSRAIEAAASRRMQAEQNASDRILSKHTLRRSELAPIVELSNKAANMNDLSLNKANLHHKSMGDFGRIEVNGEFKNQGFEGPTRFTKTMGWNISEILSNPGGAAAALVDAAGDTIGVNTDKIELAVQGAVDKTIDTQIDKLLATDAGVAAQAYAAKAAEDAAVKAGANKLAATYVGVKTALSNGTFKTAYPKIFWSAVGVGGLFALAIAYRVAKMVKGRPSAPIAANPCRRFRK
jgi:hypothetical protein